jgi:hypothetical protein
MDQFPRGKFSEDDEGALEIAIGTKDRTLIIHFGKSVHWIGMDHDAAVRLAENILKHAKTIAPARDRA